MPIRRDSHRVATQAFGFAFAALALFLLAAPAFAQEINCANEFRSGKLYFDQAKKDPILYEKAVGRFQVAAEACPDNWEFRARYAMALCGLGRYYLDQVPVPTLDSPDTLVTRALEFYAKAGEEFNAALECPDAKKKTEKFVADNRGHYWANNYNEAIELQEDDNLLAAEFRFHVARLIDPNDLRAIGSEAIVKVQLEKVNEAMELVENGLAKNPDDERLHQIKDSIMLDVAREQSETGYTEQDCAKLADAIAMYDELLAQAADDVNLLFERGLALLNASNLSCNEAQKVALATRSAEDFGNAAGLIAPEGDDRQFHLDCKFNQMQALAASEDMAGALKVNEDYLCLEPLDPLGWELLATTKIGADDQAGAVSALMMAKSLATDEVPVNDAVAAAKADSKAALDAMGSPDQVWSYQEASSGNQIQTWVWSAQKKAMSFILGQKQGEVTWCN